MKALYALVAVVVLLLVGYVGAGGADLEFVFGIVVPYAAVALFLVGFSYRILKWARSAVPFRITTTCGQQKSLPFIKSDNLRITGYAPLLFQPTVTPDKGSLSINTTTPTLKYRVLDTVRDALAYEDEFVIKRRVADPEERMLEAVMRAFLENMNGH